jgi:phosphoribosylanthranilate isomerase
VKRIRTKICGITRVEDALCAAELGVDALGFVFYEKSPRYISPVAAGQIIARLPPFVSTVGLFVNPDEEVVDDAVLVSGVQLLQFHGEETDEFCMSFGRPYIKALRVSQELDISTEMSHYRYASGILLDSFVQGEFGGTGQSFNWDLVPGETDQAIILAGGLTPENVETAIKKTSPYGVDVSGGVESSKGKKDSGKMKLFLETVRGMTEDE